ncbi:PD-(D/E)XK nuclease family protein [Caldisphaera sp.]|uniref:PD-(D/E)XK nuclease family protein n=1 Tax=Caldisphaera sp. TaxID=2060322 RepID=UPI00397CCD63
MKSEELKEEIKKILLDNPTIIADVIISKPEIIYQVLAKLTPWQSLATKDDIREVKNSLSKLEIKVTSLEEKVGNIDKQFATKEDISKLVTKEEAKQFATKEDISKLVTKEEAKQFATKEDISKLVTKEEAKQFATKEDISKLVTKEEAKQFATKEDIKKLENIINAIGARWGIMSESSFRNGIYEILKDIGWEIKNEIIYDKEGYVYNEPSEIEIDIVIKDGNTMIIEIMSSLKRSDLPIIKKKKELYEKKYGIKVNQVIVITPFIHDKYQGEVIAMANTMGIKIITSLDNIK